MNTLNRKLLLVTAGALWNGLLAPLASAAAATAADRAQLAVERTAARAALPVESLAVAQSTKMALPLQGRNAYAFKVLDKTTGRILRQAVDDDGNDVDADALFNKEQALYESWYGRVDERLVNRLSSARISDQMEVDIWVKTPSVEGPAIAAIDSSSVKQSSAAAAAAAEPVVAETRARQAQQVKSAVRPVIDRLAAMGYTVSWSGTVPLLHVTLSPEHLQQVGRWSEVLRVYPKVTPRSMGDAYTIARPTVGADVVQQRGITGAVRIAQVEVGGLIYQNPNLSNIYVDTGATLCTVTKNPDHSAAVAGIMHWTAPGAAIFATGSCDGTQLLSRTVAAINWGAAVTNSSWGEGTLGGADNQLDSSDRTYDYNVINYRRLQVVAAGNDGRTTGNVSSPGSAYNVLTVGNYDDRNTVAWTNPVDTMNPDSGYRNPASQSGDRQKPEVAAPGTNFYSATNSGTGWGFVGSGTSYAAPVVTSIAAMLIQRAPALVNFPVATKAIIMATAIHNIEGASRLSDRDGAGGVWAPYADDVARGVNGGWAAFNYTCSTPTQKLATIQLVAGKLTRVVIAWNTDSAYTYWANRPSADYDLTIVSPIGAMVTSSTSFDNTYEIVEFTPSSSGPYSIQANKDRCELSPRTLAYAWYRNP